MYCMSPAEKLLDYVKNGSFDAYDVLENVLTNWMSSDEANEFAEREYDISSEDSED